VEVSQTIFVCEGYHDRGFLAGWLTVLGCDDLSVGATGVQKVKDPWGKPVIRGQFGYTDRLKRFLRIIPAHGESQCFSVADGLLQGRDTQRIRDLFVVVDQDDSASRREDQFQNLVQKHSGTFTSNRLAVLGDGTKIHLLVLAVPQSVQQDHLPGLQSLERVVCAAIAAAYPGRAKLVARWLTDIGASEEPAAFAKSHSWSHMAGWYPKFGCDAFHSQLWQDDQVKAHLIAILSQSGAWQAVSRALGSEIL
jgi:hypothetical protein